MNDEFIPHCILCIHQYFRIAMKSVNTDVAYNHIRKRILSGEYPPGHPLMTELLANEIKVSRTPVRDALRKLETDGLVTIQAHLGASVKKMQLKEFREMCDLRLALESHAAGLAALNRTDADLSEIQFALEAMRRLTAEIASAPEEQPLISELVHEDVRFHIAVMTAAKNELMKKEILGCISSIEWSRAQREGTNSPSRRRTPMHAVARCSRSTTIFSWRSSVPIQRLQNGRWSSICRS